MIIWPQANEIKLGAGKVLCLLCLGGVLDSQSVPLLDKCCFEDGLKVNLIGRILLSGVRLDNLYFDILLVYARAYTVFLVKILFL